jgi:hypothetical protein
MGPVRVLVDGKPIPVEVSGVGAQAKAGVLDGVQAQFEQAQEPLSRLEKRPLRMRRDQGATKAAPSPVSTIPVYPRNAKTCLPVSARTKC